MEQKARDGVHVLIPHVSIVTRRGHSILAKRPGKTAVPADEKNLLSQKYPGMS